MAIDKREQLIDTAVKLFYSNGFHATGIDRILAAAGVAKMTLYNHFRSKDELILAALQRRDESFRAEFKRSVEAATEVPRERILAVFDVLDQWIRGPNFNGCLFINASAEFGDRNDPIHAEAAAHKRHFTAFLCDLAYAAKLSDARQFAARLALLVEGAIVTAHVTGDSEAALKAKAAARLLLHEAIGSL